MSIYLQPIGTLAHWVLYGVLLVQICKCSERCPSLYGLIRYQYRGLYYRAFPNDQRLLKQIVLLALVLETIQTIMFTQHVLQAITRGFSNLLLADVVGTLWFSVPLMTGLSMFILTKPIVHFTEIFVVALLTQVFYCYRVAILTQSKFAVAVIIMVRDTTQYSSV